MVDILNTPLKQCIVNITINKRLVMAKMFVSLFYSIVLFFVACDLPVILSGDNQSTQDRQNKTELADTVLSVEITGGFAGVSQNLVVDESGLAIFEDSFHPGAEWVIQLSSAELDSLTQLMLENNFFQLNGEFFDEMVADAFNYAIHFRYNDQINTVKTDYFGAPEELKRIVDGIVRLKDKVTQPGLELKLELSKIRINVGEQVELTLLVTNTSEKPLTLHFTSGQIFDFYAKLNVADNDIVTWNWSHDKVFTQILWDLVLESGETKTYQVTWNGSDNSGNLVIGEYIIGAELLSIPGGSPEQKLLHIGGE